MYRQEDIVLRPWRGGDAPDLARLANNLKVAQFMTDGFPHPYTAQDAEKFISFATSHQPVRIFAIEFKGDLAGGIGLHPQHDISRMNAELGYWIAEQYWGLGIATRAVKLLAGKGFELMGVSRIYARPFGTNVASQRVLQKAGFKLEAIIPGGFIKNGRYIDEHIYAIREQGILT